MTSATAQRARSRSQGRTALLQALTMLAGVVVVYEVFVRSSIGQQLDIMTLSAVGGSNHGWGGLAGRVRDDLPVPLAAIVVVLGLFAVAARRWRAVLAGAILLLVPFAIGHQLKTALARPYLGANGYADNTFPSGHTIVLASLLVTTAVLLPGRLRLPAVSLGLALLTLLCALASVVSYAHRPSDVVSGLLLVGAVSVPAGHVAGPLDAVVWPAHTWRPILWAAGTAVVMYVVLWLGPPYAGLETVTGNLATLTAIAAATLWVFAASAQPQRREDERLSN